MTNQAFKKPSEHMRILYILTQDLESPTGVGRFLPLAKYMARLGHQVSIIALHSNFAGLQEKKFTQEGVLVEYVAQMHVMKDKNQKRYFGSMKLIALMIQATLALCKAALREKRDIIHIGKPHPMNSIAGILAHVLKGGCLFLDYDDYEAMTGHFTNRLQKMGVTFFEDRVPHLVQHITTHNSFLRDRYLKIGISSENITILPNGVDIERFKPVQAEEIAILRNELSIHEQKVIGYIGSLSSPSHPVDLLLKAFSRVHQEMPETLLVITGAGDDYAKLQLEAAELGISQVTRFTGFIPPDKVPAYYQLADVLVDPVHDDPSARGRLPLKLFESWISGTPFITSDVGDRGAILGSPPAGELVRAGDVTDLSLGLLKILRDQEYANLLRKRGFEQVEKYSWEYLASQLEALYIRILRQKSKNFQDQAEKP